MNHIYRLIWNNKTGAYIAVSEIAKSSGRKTSSGTIAKGVSARCALQAVAISALMALGANAYALPTGGVVAAGGANISGGAGTTTITQSTPNVSINWQGFSIGQGEAVQFVQPTSSSIALNRVLGSDPSSILGSLLANGKVFLVNPNGILFGKGASVNVGGLVASTLNITDADFMASTYNFVGEDQGKVVNQGSINTNVDGGYVALLGANVNNEGVIAAKLGSVALAAGNAITLDVAGDGLLNVTVNQGAVQTLVENGGLIQAAGGQVLLTARAAGNLLSSAVNNTGVIQAQSIENHNGTIRLMGDMQTGTVNVGGTLDASAPNGGDGGFIETSAAYVKVADKATVTTKSAQGKFGTWLIDPVDYKVDSVANGGDQTGAALSAALDATNITILSSDGLAGTNGDVLVNEAVTWTAPTTLTLTADRDVSVAVGAAITGTDGSLVATATNGDININEAITTTTGSLTLTAKNNVNLAAASTVTTGNIKSTAGKDVNITAASTITTGDLTAIAGGNVNVSAASSITTGDMIFQADNDGTGPGAAAGTVAITCGANCLTINTGELNIHFNPADYTTTGAEILAYGTHLTGGGTLNAKAWVFAQGKDKVYDGTTATTVDSLKPDLLGNLPPGESLTTVGAIFDSKNVGTNKLITFDSSTLTGSADYALFAPFGTPVGGPGTTSADITKLDTDISGTRVYNATTVAAGSDLTTISALIAGDSVTVNGVGALATKDVGVNKAVTDLGTLTLASTDASNYNLVNGALTVTKLNTNISGTKVYDATPTAAGTDLTTITGLLAGDTVTVSGSGAVATKDVGVNKDITNMGTLALASADAGNYNLGTGALTVTKLNTNVSGTKVYDATTTAAGTDLTTIDGLLAGDTVTVSGSGAVTTKDVGVNKNITNMGTLALASADAGNYNLGTGALTVTKLNTNISGTKVYDATTTAAGTDLTTIDGLLAGDTVTVSGSGAVATKDVGVNKNITNMGTLALASTDAGNYNLGTGALTVTKLNTDISGTKVYDATTTAAGADLTTIDGLLAGDTVTVSGSGAVATKDVGVNKDITNMGTLTLTSADAGNYNLGTGSLTVTKLNTNVSGTKVYDATTTAAGTNLTTIDGLLAGDTVTVSGSGAVATKDVGVNKDITNMGTLTLTSADAGNYNLGSGALTVTKLNTNISGTKVYDATTTAAGTDLTTIDGLLAGDTVTVSGGGAVATKDVGVNKNITNMGTLTLASVDAGNYNLGTGALTVTKLNTNVSGTKVYDATPTAAGTNLTTIDGLLAGDTVTVSGSGAVATKDVGINKDITNMGTLTLTSADAGNYNLGSGALTVTKLNTNISGTKVYDATTTAAGTNLTTIDGLLAGDTVTVSGSGAVATKDVGVNKNITNMGTLALASADAGNYNLGTGALTITKLNTNISGSKVYDATPTAAGTDLTTINGLLAGDTVTVSGSGAVATKDVGVNKNITNMGTLALASADAGNYNLGTGALTITPTQLTVTASDGVKPYGQTIVLSAFTSEGLLNNETIGSVTETSPGTVATASVVGSPYVITPSNATGGTFAPTNYDIEYVNGELFVTPIILPKYTAPPMIYPPVTPESWIPVKVVLPDQAPQMVAVWPLVVPVTTPTVTPVVEPIKTPPAIYVPPQYVRKQDRN